MKLSNLALCSALFLSACSRISGSSELPADSVIKGVSYVGASVSDLDKTMELYQNAVDLKLVDDSKIANNPLIDQIANRSGVEADTRMMRSVNAQVRFMSFLNSSAEAKATQPMAVQGPGIMHVCYQVLQETKSYQKFLAGGAKYMGAKEMQQLNPKNPVYYSYSRDFDGLIAEIEHVDITKLDLPKPPKNQHRIRHVSLATPNIDRLVDFYAVFLDQPSPRRGGRWPFTRSSSEKGDNVSGLKGGKAEAAWFQVRNLELEMFQFHSHPTKDLAKPRPIDAHGYNMIVFDVADMKLAREQFLRAGGKIVTEAGPMDGGQIMFGRDPDGNLIGLQTAPTNAMVSSRNFKNNGIE